MLSSRPPSVLLCGLLAAAVTLVTNIQGGYVITTPRKWSSNGLAQVCVYLTDPESVAAGGAITVSLHKKAKQGFGPPPRHPGGGTAPKPEKPKDLITPKLITLTPGLSELCDKINITVEESQHVDMIVEGKLANINVKYNKTINIREKIQRIFLQTDKFLYKPGQKVQFRILSITGPFLNISDTKYDEILIKSPSGSRLAQWLNHNNSDRLVHLEFQLAEEPEEGKYKIIVKQGKTTKTQTFKVEEFVLPRYEVTLKPPKYILRTDEKFNFTVCAKYTYGANVKGNLTIMLDNGGWGKNKVEITKNLPINGCKDIEITAEEMKRNCTNHYQYNINAYATVVEDGTGVELKGDSVSASIERTAISFKDQGKEKYMKPALPFTGKVKCEFPDGSPAANEPMQVCYGETCKLINTDPKGLLTFVVPPQTQDIVQVKAEFPHGSPAKNESMRICVRNICKSTNTDSNDLLKFVFPPKNTVQIKAVNYPRIVSNETRGRHIMYESSYTYTGKLVYSPSDSSLIIRPPLGTLSCNGEHSEITLPIMFAATNQTKAKLYVQVVSRGKIQYMTSKKVEFVSGNLPIDEDSLLAALQPPSQDAVKGLLNIDLQLPHTVSPKAKIVVWYERDDGEVVADTQEVKMQKCLSNDVDLFWSAPKVQPGEQATLTLSAEPNSICSLGVVDKSVELLSSQEDDLTVDKVFEMVESAMISEYENAQTNDYEYCEKKLNDTDDKSSGTKIHHRYYDYYSDYSDALKMFDISGLYYFSDLTVETRPCKRRERYPVHESHFHFAPAFDSGAGVKNTETDSKARSYFPETWLWDLRIVPSGINEQQITVPDTITEWVGKAVCVHPKQGLGLSPRAAITTFTPFFMDLTLPPTIKRGELLPVKISIFNYEKQHLPVTIILEPSEDYEIVSSEGKAPGVAGTRSSCVPSDDKYVHTIKIRPTALGDVNITVAAFVDDAFPHQCGGKNVVSKRDLLIKPIKVEAEGFPQEKTWTKYICSNDIEEQNDFLERWQVEAPPAIVPDSARGWVTAVGDLMGPTIDNLGSLVRMPSGCGEQNMLNFAPNIFILQYLDASNQTTKGIKKKITDYMKSGYQRELRYQHNNGHNKGSFSAFGESDASGSTWLTAFVLKSFAQARQYIQVDEIGLQTSLEWLKSKQQKNGCFESVGKVFNKGMKGGIDGSGSPAPLTAYVMISLLEAGENRSITHNSVIRDAAFCIQADKSKDPYTQALKAYALSLANHPEAQSAVSSLINLANEDSSSMSWEVATSVGKSQSVAVETAGYAILAMMTLNAEVYNVQSRKVVKWISSQRNGQGGFISTQDTVVALQAMARFEAIMDQGPVDMTVLTSLAESVNHKFVINEDNKLLQQMVTLPSIPTSVSLNMVGTGCALLQAVLRYNIPEPEPAEGIVMTVSTETEPDRLCNTKRIKTCASYTLQDGISNMAVIEVKLISGYIPEKADLKEIVGDGTGLIKRHEVDDNLVTFYVDELSSEDICVDFRVTREIDVEDAKPGTVRVYDYYQTEFSVSKSYTLPPNDECLSI